MLSSILIEHLIFDRFTPPLYNILFIGYEDVPDMNVGDMVNECTSEDNASYTIQFTPHLSLI
jgi:hypothetical protein